jgi:hypothetical protein
MKKPKPIPLSPCTTTTPKGVIGRGDGEDGANGISVSLIWVIVRQEHPGYNILYINNLRKYSPCWPVWRQYGLP